MQKERFRRPEPGFSLYEGRTRGKRAKYTYDDEEDFYTDSTNNRRSTRNTRNHTPIETGPTITASGRQSRPPGAAPSVQGDGFIEDSIIMGENETSEVGPTGRPRRSAAVHHGTNGWSNPKKRRHDYLSDDEDDSEPDLNDDDEEEAEIPDESEDDKEEFEADPMDTEDEIVADSPRSTDSRVVKLKIKVKVDKAGKVSRLENGDSTPSASTPSNVGSSPDTTADSVSEGSPIPSHEPERTGDAINVASFKRAEPQQPPAPAATTATTAHFAVISPPTTQNDVVQAPLVFRESPVKKPQAMPQNTPPATAIRNGE